MGIVCPANEIAGIQVTLGGEIRQPGRPGVGGMVSRIGALGAANDAQFSHSIFIVGKEIGLRHCLAGSKQHGE